MPEFDYSLLKSYGKNCYISSNVVIKRPHLVTVGSNIAIDDFFYCTTGLIMGDYLHCGPMVSIIGGGEATAILSDFVTIAAGCRLIVRGDKHLGEGLVSPVVPNQYRDEVIGGHIILHKFVGLGTNVVIMPNVTIAPGVVIGANSLVTKSITDEWTIWAGSPARKIKYRRSDLMLQYARELGYE